jgi:hypothetical protein
MEDVYSEAYCVLAATSAHGQHDGFLKHREERKYITIRKDPLPPIHICEFKDNFQQHVLDSNLNKRGWVLQERVLARRTIYFTDKQTYWECGSGVRCETMSKMQKYVNIPLNSLWTPKTTQGQVGQANLIKTKANLHHFLAIPSFQRLRCSHLTEEGFGFIRIYMRSTPA